MTTVDTWRIVRRTKTKTRCLIFPLVTFLILGAAFAVPSPAAETSEPRSNPDESEGSLEGLVLDKETGLPVSGARVSILGIERITSTDTTGLFSFENLIPDEYTVHITSLGYRPLRRPDIRVAPNKSVRIEIALAVLPVPGKSIIVTGRNFDRLQSTSLSTVVLSRENIRQSPGTLGDVNRALSSTAGLARIDDRYNSLIVRGGSPIENGLYIDNIEVSNISHFPSQGTSSGPLGILRTNLVDNITFHTGGFPVEYGNKLSSVMDIDLQEGSRDRLHAQASLDFAGAGFTLHGPMNKGRGSWLLSARKGFLDILLDALDVDARPNYTDIESRIVYDIDSSLQFSVLTITGFGNLGLGAEGSRRAGISYHGDMDYATTTVGTNWRYLWGRSASQVSVSYSRVQWLNDNKFVDSDIALFENQSTERILTLRSINNVFVTDRFSFRFGADFRNSDIDYDYYLGDFIGQDGYRTDEVTVDEFISTIDVGAFGSLTWHPFPAWTTTVGTRFDNSGYSGRSYISPRLSIRYRINTGSMVYAAVGVYRQSLPFAIRLQTPEASGLGDPRADHVIVGLNMFVARDARLQIELYNKEYSHLPVDSARPTTFLLDELILNYGFFSGHDAFTNNGTAYSRGIEVTADWDVLPNLNIQSGLSVYSAKYIDWEGKWRHRVSDNRYTFNSAVAYAPNRLWSFAASLQLGGGVPYTPYDLEQSSRYNDPVYDHARTNELRTPDYQSLSLRCERRFQFQSSVLTTYLEIWNVLNRRNIVGYYWDESTSSVIGVQQIPFLPVFGLEFRF